MPDPHSSGPRSNGPRAAGPRRDAPARTPCSLKSKILRGPDGKSRVYTCSQLTRQQIVERSGRWLELIAGVPLAERDRADLVRLTIENFENFFNRGIVEYRKSVTEAQDFAALEWDGEGSIIRDLHGREYIDCLGGFGIYNVGIKHPLVIKAVRDQLQRMPLSSQELLDPLRAALAEMLGELAPGDLQECFFINNGTDAMEGAMKLARLATGRTGFISTLRGFHGKSMGSLSLMGKSEYRRPFEPLLDNVHFIPYGDALALEEELQTLDTLGTPIAAFVAEPVQGEAGAIVPPDDYFPRVRELCTQHGILLILDEVQTGFGRTGKMFACEHWGVVPDILCLGKAIGGGVMPLSAFMSNPATWRALEEQPFLHSSTFGGNPLACAAGLAAIHILCKEDMPRQAAERGAYLMPRLREVQRRHADLFADVHGKGLLIGLDFASPETGYAVSAGLFKRGVLVAGTLIGIRTIRIEPALNIPYALLDKVLDRLDDTLAEIARRGKEARPAPRKHATVEEPHPWPSPQAVVPMLVHREPAHTPTPRKDGRRRPSGIQARRKRAGEIGPPRRGGTAQKRLAAAPRRRR
jgi:putrescine aminotransferase